jgi:hypothetical protein
MVHGRLPELIAVLWPSSHGHKQECQPFEHNVLLTNLVLNRAFRRVQLFNKCATTPRTNPSQPLCIITSCKALHNAIISLFAHLFVIIRRHITGATQPHAIFEKLIITPSNPAAVFIPIAQVALLSTSQGPRALLSKEGSLHPPPSH